MNKPFWEEAYQASDKTFDGGKPSNDIMETARLLAPESQILDIGCGDGRNSIHLAQMGHHVTSIDISESGITRLKRTASALNLNIEAQVVDAVSFNFNKRYDLILAYGVLHLLDTPDRKSILTKIQQFTNPGGYNVILVFTNELPPPEDLKKFMIGLYNEGELFKEYGDWNIVKEISYILHDEHPGGIKHHHPINKIICQKKVKESTLNTSL